MKEKFYMLLIKCVIWLLGKIGSRFLTSNRTDDCDKIVNSVDKYKYLLYLCDVKGRIVLRDVVKSCASDDTTEKESTK